MSLVNIPHLRNLLGTLRDAGANDIAAQYEEALNELDAWRESSTRQYEKLKAGKLHEVHCNAQAGEVGDNICCCYLGSKIKKLKVRAMIAEGALDEIKRVVSVRDNLNQEDA